MNQLQRHMYLQSNLDYFMYEDCISQKFDNNFFTMSDLGTSKEDTPTPYPNNNALDLVATPCTCGSDFL